jgi:hypothetical protein
MPRSQTKRRIYRLLVCMGVPTLMIWTTIAADAQDANSFHEIETKYIFGNFTVGSAIGIEGERAFEPDTQMAYGKRGGRYFATQTTFEFEYTPTQYFQFEFGPTVSYYNIHNVPGLDDRNTGGINGIEADFRSLIIDRGPSPLAVTLSIEPEWHSLDETSGTAVSNYSLEAKIEADVELVKNRLFLGFNLLYEPETTIDPLGASFKESTFGVSSALAFQIYPKVAIGADLWYLSHYQGIVFDSFTGDSIYLGPTFYWQITPKVLVSAAWQAQVAGREVGVVPALDLTDFSRQRARLLFEFEF